MEMLITLSNGVFSAKIAKHGAELRSFVRLADGKEFIWQRDPKFWEDSAPMLFPICGRLNDGRYTYNGATYHMMPHGFLQTLDPTEVRATETAVDLIFCDNDATYAQYPFHFVLTVRFALSACGLRCSVTVENTDEKTMYCSIGAHPGFSLPLKDGCVLEDHYLRFPEAGEVEQAIIDPEGLFTGELPPYALAENNEIRLSEEQFAIDGIFLRGVGGVTELHCDGADSFIRVVCPMSDLVGTWKEYGADARFLCLEPWCGYPSVTGVADVLQKKLGLYALDFSKKSEFYYDVEILPETN